MNIQNTLKTIFKAGMLAFALLATFQLSLAQQPGKNGGNLLNFFNTGGQNALLQNGSFGTFNAGDRWISYGQAPGTPTSLFGFRIQDDKQAMTLSINEDGGTGVKDTELQWGIDPDSRFRLNFIFDPFAGVALNVMTAQSSGRVGISEDNPDNYDSRLVVIGSVPDNDKFALYTENLFYAASYHRGKNIGSWGTAFDNTGGLTRGSYGSAGGTSTNYGVYGRSSSSNSAQSAGVYGTISGSGTNNYAGYFAGDVVVTGSFSSGSDRRLKQDIQDETNVMDRLMQVRPTTYLYRQEGKFKEMNLADGDQHGFIAQELETVFPELVNESAFVFGHAQGDEITGPGEEKTEQFDFKTVNYQAMIPILTKGIQEQQIIIEEQQTIIEEQQTITEDQEARIAALTEQMEKLAAALGQPIDKQATGLDANLIKGSVLYQNSPNPFDAVTEIKYELALETSTAEIIIFDMNGRQVRKFSNLKPGSASIRLDGSQLDSGMYLYSLIVNGQELDTKRMILTD